MSGRFVLDNYDTVDSRLDKFWADHPLGRVHTDLVFRDDRQYIFRAEVYTDRDDTRPAAVGHAEEVVGSTPVNKTAALENCETSAIGRALANLNYATKARPSQSEMAKAQREPSRPASRADEARAELRRLAGEKGWDLGKVAVAFSNEYGETLKQSDDAALIEAFTASLVANAEHVLRDNG